MSPAPTPRTTRGRTGVAAEAVARRHLEERGWTIVAVNVVVGHGELDLVALDPHDPGALVVVEVRGARTARFGAPEESVDARKLARLRTSVSGLLRSEWLADHGLGRPRMVRFDVVAVELARGMGRGPVVRHLRGVDGP
jgi:putative endonuclease